MKQKGSFWKAVLWFVFGLLAGWLLGRISPVLAHTNTNGEWGNWKDTSICQQLSCGSSEGIKTQSRICEYDNGENECKPEKWECPTDSSAYTSTDDDKDCSKLVWVSGHWRTRYADKVKTQEADTETREIKCEVAEPTQCEEEGVCPTECGLEASEIPDGKGGYKICEATLACVIPTPEPQRSVSEASAPQCGDIAPVLLPANPLVWRRGNDAIVQWQPTAGNKANVYYREIGNPTNAHSIRDTENDGYVEIGLLSNLDWEFGIQQSQGCAGDGVVWVIDSSTNGWVLFRP